MEGDSLKSACQRLAVEREACHLLQPLRRRRALRYCCIPVPPARQDAVALWHCSGWRVPSAATGASGGMQLEKSLCL